MLILGVETSCDETAASVVENGVKIRSNVVSSSLTLHAKTGGIIPETAAREQLKSIVPVIEEALTSAAISHTDLQAIAVTAGPGLFGSLIVGVEASKIISYLWDKDLIPVNHLIGHIYSNWLDNPNPPTFPNLVLIVSGGHSELVLAKNHGDFTWLGGTRDDAAGEAFDKTARVLGLSYPGGPAIQKAALEKSSLDNTLPRPLKDSDDFDFSFSGLKTAVVNQTRGKVLKNPEVANLSASIQEAIVDSLLIKTVKAAKKFQINQLLLAGGVAANKRLVEKAKDVFPGRIYAPTPSLCIDNGAMIASAAFFNYKPRDWSKVYADSGLFFEQK